MILFKERERRNALLLLTHLLSLKPLAHRTIKLGARVSAVTSLSRLLHTSDSYLHKSLREL